MTTVRPSSTPVHQGAAPVDIVVVGGGGHVGLPLSLRLAEVGFSVGIFDIAEATIDKISAGGMPFVEPGAEALLADLLPSGRLTFSSTPDIVRGVEVVIIVIGTATFDRAVAQLAPYLADGALVILRSTVYPGTTARVARALESNGRRMDVAFCPERVAEGKALEELGGLPQIVGADEDSAGERAAQVFRRLGAATIRTGTREAELAKLFTNAWRYMKFAVANQFFMMAHDAGVDYNEVLHAVRHDYPRAQDLPGPGFAAGPCLPKDTMQLAAFTSDHFAIGQASMRINEGLPAYVVSAMERRFGTLTGRTVGILGMAFKAESDDTRASLSYKLRELLGWAGADVRCTDPYVDDQQLLPLGQVMEQSEILVIGAPHRIYRSLDIAPERIVDIWGITESGIVL